MTVTVFTLSIFILGGCNKNSVPTPSRIVLKQGGFSIVPPKGWIEFQTGIPFMEKERIKVGAKTYILKRQKNYRYQDTFGFACLQKQPTPEELKNSKKNLDGKYIYYDTIKHNIAKQNYYSFTRIINHGSSWFYIEYNTYIEKLEKGNSLVEYGLPDNIVKSVESFKIEGNSVGARKTEGVREHRVPIDDKD